VADTLLADYRKANPVCELCVLLGELEPPGWDEYQRVWSGHPQELTLDVHHIHGSREGHAHWNLIRACRVAHEFVQSNRVGRLVCTLVKESKRPSEFPREEIRQALGRDPVGLIRIDLDNGVFSGRCRIAAERFSARHSYDA
jgi:hypothetical protein